MNLHHDANSNKYHHKYREPPIKKNQIIYVEKKSSDPLNKELESRYYTKEQIIKEYVQDFENRKEQLAELVNLCRDCFYEKSEPPENLKSFDLDPKNAFVTLNKQLEYNLAGEKGFERGNNYNNAQDRSNHYYEEPIPEWAKDDNLNDFKDFEFRTIDKPSRPKKENIIAPSKNIPQKKEERKINPKNIEEGLKKILTANDEFKYSAVDELMESRLKEIEFMDEEEIDEKAFDLELETEEKPEWEEISPEELKKINSNKQPEIKSAVGKPQEPSLENLMSNLSIEKNVQFVDEIEQIFSTIYPSNKEYNTINLFSLFVQKLGTCGLNYAVWYYKDPQGDTQGPFSSIDMDCWNLDKYFPLHLPVAFIQTTQFVTIEYFRSNPSCLIKLAQRYSSMANVLLGPLNSSTNNDMRNFLMQQMKPAMPAMSFKQPVQNIGNIGLFTGGNNNIIKPQVNAMNMMGMGVSSGVGVGVGGSFQDPLSQLLKIVNNNAQQRNNNVQPNQNLNENLRNNPMFQKQQIGIPSVSQPTNFQTGVQQQTSNINTNNLKMLLGLNKVKEEKIDFPSLAESLGKH